MTHAMIQMRFLLSTGKFSITMWIYVHSYTVHSSGTCMYQLWYMHVLVKLHLSCTVLAHIRTTIQLRT